MNRIVYRLAALIWVGLVLLAAVGGRLTDYYYSPPRARAVTETVDIPAGRSLTAISDSLARRGIIKRPWLFTTAVRLVGLARKVRAGEYYLSAAMSPYQVITRLTTGPPVLHKVTIPEGLTMEDIAETLADRKLISADKFLAAAADEGFLAQLGIPGHTAEGYLFPETYHLPKGLTARAIIKIMVNRYREVYGRLKREIPSTTGLNDFQTLILASMVEAEIQVAEEGPLVAAVYLNRLNRDMRLQCDPTVIYGLKDFSGRLRRIHLKIRHAYNTYIYPGLPPGPICNPGETALRAALAPAKVDYLFFVSRRDGTHQFSQTFAQHKRAIRTYRKR